MSSLDTGIIGVYFCLIVVISLLFRRFSRDSSGFIRGGGAMMWWMASATAFMTQFSAWTFTGAAAKAYEDGLTVLFLFWGNALGFFVAATFFAARFRKLRVDTPMEVIQQRFGTLTEQLITWLQFPLSTISAAIWLNGLALFTAAVLNIDLYLTIVGIGVLVTLIAISGGSWTVSATNVVQLILLMAVTLIVGAYALVHIGGPGELVRQFPAESVLTGNGISSLGIFVFWVTAIMAKQTIGTNNALTCYRFLVTTNEREAKKAAFVTGLLFIVGPVMWFIPPWVSATPGLDLATLYPNLGDEANSAAYLHFIMHHMPDGLLGLVLAAMIAATVSPLTTLLNRNAGIFIKSVYLPLKNGKATDQQQVRCGKWITALNGGVAIGAALLFASLKEVSFFDLMMLFGALLQIPMSIPGLLAVVITRTPDWSGWATLLVGLLVSLFMQFVFDVNWLLPLFSAEAFTAREAIDLKVALTLLAHMVITGGFFALTTLFYQHHKEHPARLAVRSRFRMNMRRAIRLREEAEVDHRQAFYLGSAALLIGGLVAGFGMLLGSDLQRTVFVAIGALILLSGYGLHRHGARPA